MPRSVQTWGGPPVLCQHSTARPVIVTIAGILAFGWWWNKLHPGPGPKPAGHPAPAPVTRTITRTVTVHAGHLLSGPEMTVIWLAVIAAVVAVVAIIGRRWGR